MDRIKTTASFLSLACAALVCAPLQAQTVHPVSPTQVREKPIPAIARPMPFRIDGPDAGPAAAVEFRSADRMSARDREVAANAESSITENTRYSDLEFNQGNWSYEQVVCSAFPEHLFLRFNRNNGAGDVSLFTASIPRGNEGRVRILPIQLRGYSLFSPAPINAMTISVFNHIRAEENPEHTPVNGWVDTGLCYAALAGGRPELPPMIQDAEHQKLLASKRAELEIPNRGGGVISFDDMSAMPRPMEWTMVFDGKGKLLKAAHTVAELIAVNRVHPTRVDPNGKKVLAIPAPEKTTAIPPAPSQVNAHPTVIPPTVLHSSPIPPSNLSNQAVQPGLQAGLSTPAKSAIRPA